MDSVNFVGPNMTGISRRIAEADRQAAERAELHARAATTLQRLDQALAAHRTPTRSGSWCKRCNASIAPPDWTCGCSSRSQDSIAAPHHHVQASPASYRPLAGQLVEIEYAAGSIISVR